MHNHEPSDSGLPCISKWTGGFGARNSDIFSDQTLTYMTKVRKAIQVTFIPICIGRWLCPRPSTWHKSGYQFSSGFNESKRHIDHQSAQISGKTSLFSGRENCPVALELLLCYSKAINPLFVSIVQVSESHSRSLQFTRVYSELWFLFSDY